MTTKIYHIYDEGEGGEIEGMFTEDGELLGGWCLNDANWRSEYMNGFMAALGIQVLGEPKSAKKRKEMLQKLRERLGA